MKFIINFFLGLIPCSLIIGTNFDISNFVGFKIAIGYTDILIVCLLIFLIFFRTNIILPKKIVFLYLITIFFIFLSFLSSNFSISNASIIELIKWVEYFLLFVVIYCFTTLDNILISFRLLLFSSIVFLTVAIYQAFTFNYYEKRIYGTFQSSADISFESISNPNVAGAFLTGCFLFFYALQFFYTSKKKYFYRGLQLVTFILVVATLSRSAFLGLIFGILILRKLLNKNLGKYFIFLSLIIIIFVFAYESGYFADYSDFVIFDRLISSFDSSSISGSSITGRIENSSIILDLAIENFFFGIGFGDLENKYKLIPDNYYIHTFAEIGFLGLISFLCLNLTVIYDLFSFIKNNFKVNYFYLLVVISLTINITFLIENYAANLFRNPRLLGLYWYLLALIYKYHFLIRNKVIEKK